MYIIIEKTKCLFERAINTIYSILMMFLRKLAKLYLALNLIVVSSCSTIESTLDSTWDSISETGDYIYDSVNFWDEDEPEQSEAIIIEEAVEVPEYAIPELNQDDGIISQQPNFSQQMPAQPYYDPIYRSARQYYFGSKWNTHACTSTPTFSSIFN